MATAKDCFSENVQLIGTPAGASREVAIAWNLNNGLRMLAEEVARLHAEQRQISHQLTQLQQALARIPQSR